MSTDSRSLAGTSNGSLKPKSLVPKVSVAPWPDGDGRVAAAGGVVHRPDGHGHRGRGRIGIDPPFGAPPLSWTWNWNWAYVGPLALAAGTNLRLPPAICAAVTRVARRHPLAVQGQGPALGSVVIRMPLNWLAGVSCVSKLAAEKKSPVRNV